MGRYINKDLEQILEQSFTVLDKGFVRVIDYMGGDPSIVQAARVSYGDGTKTINKDRGLIRYLMKNNHTSPFEMADIKFHIKCPIFIARQWLRHRTASVNEYSARYSILKEEYYLPEANTMAHQSTENMQGRGDMINNNQASDMIDMINKSSSESFKNYTYMNENGLSREIARTLLPLNAYTEFYWKINLHNLLHFLKLRASDHAQYEIREYANTILNKIIKIWTPLVYEAFIDYRINSINLTSNQLQCIRALMLGTEENVNEKDFNLSKKEFTEVLNLLKQGE